MAGNPYPRRSDGRAPRPIIKDELESLKAFRKRRARVAWKHGHVDDPADFEWPELNAHIERLEAEQEARGDSNGE